MGIMKDQGGLATALVVAFAAMFIVALVWNFFTPFMESMVFSYAENAAGGEYSSTWQWVRFIWSVWPLVILVGLAIYVFLAAQGPQYGG